MTKERPRITSSKGSGPAVVDLFAGAGGLGLGAQFAGCDLRLSVETDSVACETLRLNEPGLPFSVCEKDVRELTGEDLREMGGVGRRESLLVVGGPPCQGFSKAAFWTEAGTDARYRQARARGEKAIRPEIPTAPPKEDERRSLVQEFWRLIRESRADAFLFENVPSILAPRHRSTIEGLIEAAEQEGFCTTLVKANAAHYGVPQRRQRVFLLAARGSVVLAPIPTHGMVDTRVENQKATITAGQALEAFAGDTYFEPQEIVTGKWAEHLKEIPPGWNYKFHTEWAEHPNPTFVTETRFWNFLLKLSPDLPSWTIAANPGPWTGPFHWTSRRLRTVEQAALQSFPEGYQFAGQRRDRVRQIGNAVPPLLAQAMIDQIVKSLNGTSY